MAMALENKQSSCVCRTVIRFYTQIVGMATYCILRIPNSLPPKPVNLESHFMPASFLVYYVQYPFFKTGMISDTLFL